jgi:hypothetical protein
MRALRDAYRPFATTPAHDEITRNEDLRMRGEYLRLESLIKKSIINQQ